MTAFNSGALVKELIAIGQVPTDAYRNAFVALAVAKGWTKARVAAWLGISRARVGQKYDKLAYYATHRSDCPVLTAVIEKAEKTEAKNGGSLVGFQATDWDDLDTASGLLKAMVDAP